MLHSIRIRLTITFLGLAAGPLVIVGLLLTLEAYTVQTRGAIALQREMAAHLSSRCNPSSKIWNATCTC